MDCKLSKALGAHGIGYNSVMRLLRKKDIKVSGKRIGSDVIVSDGDVIVVYGGAEIAAVKSRVRPDIVYSDSNIVAVNKPIGIESAGEGSMETLLREEGYPCTAVHRLDRNTCGLIIYALNEGAQEALEEAFRHRWIRKFYMAELLGRPIPPAKVAEAYLKKDAGKSLCYISDSPKQGYVPIKTGYRVMETLADTVIVEVELYTGRTHQIRAHMAHLGYPVVGDGKYGDYEYNRRRGVKHQRLCAVRVVFEDVKGVLEYLKGKTLQIDWI